MASMLRGSVEVLERFGLFDVVLPFLLVFTIVFAILEKSKILGDDDGKPKSNLNSMVAFVMGLMFITASKLVTALNIALPYVVIMVMVGISVMLVVGMFLSDEESFGDILGARGKVVVAWVVLVGTVIAVISALGWLSPIVNWIENNWNSTAAGALFFGIFMIVMIIFITRDPKTSTSGDN